MQSNPPSAVAAGLGLSALAGAFGSVGLASDYAGSACYGYSRAVRKARKKTPAQVKRRQKQKAQHKARMITRRHAK